MTLQQDQRPRFFEGQYLSADDLSAALEYGRTRAARHDLGAHTWGIAAGLELRHTTLPGNQAEVHILPGYAWDGFGRPIVVLAPFKIPAEKFSHIAYHAPTDSGGAGRVIPVWLRYDEEAGRAAQAGFEICGDEDQRSRVRETFRIEIGYRDADHRLRHDPIMLAGQSADAQEALRRFDTNRALLYDESVPHQTFPRQNGDPPPPWLIPIGVVRWLPRPSAPGHFMPATASDDVDSRRFRRYIGVVAENVYAADGAVRVRHRHDDPATTTFDPASGDLAWVEGHLRAVGDVRTAGGAFDLVDHGGDDHGTELQIRRAGDEVASAGNRSLRFVIGPPAQTNNRAAFGTRETNGAFVEKMCVVSDGNVGVGQSTPRARLEIGGGDLLMSASPGTADDPGDLIFATAANVPKGRVWANPSASAGLYLSSGSPVAQMAIDPAGNVGVGTTAPALRLDVQGDFGRLNDQATLHLFGSRIGDTGGGSLFLRSGGGVVTFDGGDRVGIGTNAPDRLLTLQDSAGAYLNVRANSGTFEVLVGADVNGGIVSTMTNHDLVLRAGVNQTHVWIKPGGNVGIGTPLPRERLEVNGRVRLGTGGAMLASGGTEFLRILRGTVSAGGSIVAGQGFTVSWFPPGIYQINFDVPFPGVPSASVTQIYYGTFEAGGDTRDNAVIIVIDTNRLKVKTGASNGNPDNRDFTFIVVGPAF